MTPPPPVPALSIRDLRVVRGRREVLRVDALDVAEGEAVAVLGPNGAGKSTLLLGAALLVEPAAGEVRLFGRSPAEVGRTVLRRETATVFQDAALLDMTARENIETALALHGVPRAERRERAIRWLGRLGVAHLAEARPHTLSGGEAQRVSIARAFAVRPRLLLLDEPFASLDYATRATLVGDVRDLLASEGTTALLVTHDHSEAELLARRALVLIDGRSAQLGPVEQVFERPATLEVARFLGYAVLPGPRLAALLGVAHQAAWGLVPPRAVAVSPEASPGSTPGTVVAVQGALGQGRLLVDIGGVVAAELPVAALRALAPQAGGRVHLRIDSGQVAWV